MDEAQIRQVAARLVAERDAALQAVFDEILRRHGGDPSEGKQPPTAEASEHALNEMLAILDEIEVQEKTAMMFAGLDALREAASGQDKDEAEDDTDVR
jgi:hypothetical protein